MLIEPIAAFTDNYIWAIIQPDNQQCILVDPGDAAVAAQFLVDRQLNLNAILITHHHDDHVGGVTELVSHYDCPVYGPKYENIPCCGQKLQEGAVVELPEFDLQLEIMEVPGHTLGHIVYYNDNYLFCGDALFSGGCGRVFEGSCEQMHNSLSKLKNLADESLVYCAHEYTATNLQFGLAVEPENSAIQQRLAQIAGSVKPSLPSNIGLEKDINVFLRCDQPAVINAAKEHVGENISTEEEVFCAIRRWKDEF